MRKKDLDPEDFVLINSLLDDKDKLNIKIEEIDSELDVIYRNYLKRKDVLKTKRKAIIQEKKAISLEKIADKFDVKICAIVSVRDDELAERLRLKKLGYG